MQKKATDPESVTQWLAELVRGGAKELRVDRETLLIMARENPEVAKSKAFRYAMDGHQVTFMGVPMVVDDG